MNARPTAVTEAPKGDAYYCELPSDPCAIVMFGASGDLAKRKLMPALYDLALHSCLAPRFRLLGFARTEMNEDDFRHSTSDFFPKTIPAGANPDVQKEFLGHLQYTSGNYDDPAAYSRLARRLNELDAVGNLGGNRLFYLATPPEVYPRVIRQLGIAGLAKPKS